MMRVPAGFAAESADFLLAALERANEAVVIVDGDLRVTHFNAAAEKIFGLDRSEILGHHARHLGINDLHQSRDSEITITRPDGSRIRAALSLSHAVIGEERRTIIVLRDIMPELERRERLALHAMIADGNQPRGLDRRPQFKNSLRQRGIRQPVRPCDRGSAGASCLPARTRTGGR